MGLGKETKLVIAEKKTFGFHFFISGNGGVIKIVNLTRLEKKNKENKL